MIVIVVVQQVIRPVHMKSVEHIIIMVLIHVQRQSVKLARVLLQDIICQVDHVMHVMVCLIPADFIGKNLVMMHLVPVHVMVQPVALNT